MKHEEELIGYCSLVDQDDSMEIPLDTKILTNMFVKSEWRDMLFGNQLIMEAMENLEEDCYVSIDCNEQKSFYEAAGFEEVSGNDHVMVRYK